MRVCSYCFVYNVVFFSTASNANYVTQLNYKQSHSFQLKYGLFDYLLMTMLGYVFPTIHPL